MVIAGIQPISEPRPDPLNPKIAFRRPKHGDILHAYLSEDISQIPISFEPIHLQHLVSEVFKDFAMANKTRFQTYGGIGLQSAAGFDEFYDTLQDLQSLQKIRQVTDGDFCHLNSLGQRFKFIFARFVNEGIRLTRARLLIARPGHIHEPHYDYDFRIHIPITTNEHCFAVFGNRTYHMPADGKSFLHNGYHLHTFRNSGSTDRIHFVAGIEGYSLLHRLSTNKFE